MLVLTVLRVKYPMLSFYLHHGSLQNYSYHENTQKWNCPPLLTDNNKGYFNNKLTAELEMNAFFISNIWSP